jgi:sirohydrochlorin cobaltochelatase
LNCSPAYLLIAHGSRDPRPHQAVDALAHAFWEQLSQQAAGHPHATKLASLAPVVGTAMLELGPLPLHEQMVRFAHRAAAAGHRVVNLLPLFLLPGVHVMDDLPEQMAIAQSQLSEDIELRLMPYVGAHPGFSHLVQFSPDQTIARVLLAHGTKRVAGNLPIEAIAAHLNATPAYWSVEPSLSDCIQQLIWGGYRHIEIQPYFLFPGGITDAIAQQIQQVSSEFAAVTFHLLPTLGMTPALVNVLTEMAILELTAA